MNIYFGGRADRTYNLGVWHKRKTDIKDNLLLRFRPELLGSWWCHCAGDYKRSENKIVWQKLRFLELRGIRN